ncbi:MAG: acylneuraminate cytidylyltransferase family protein, partial [Pseudomonadota bacterium]
PDAPLSSRVCGEVGVWQHALDEVEKITGPVATFIDLDCTSPLRLQEDLDGAIALFEAEQPDMVMSCCESRKNPYFNILEVDETGKLGVSKPLPGGVVARQQAPKVLDHVGLVYVLKPDYLRTATALFDGQVIPYEVPGERGLDVDSPIDWEIVEFLMGRQIARGLKSAP